MSSPGFVTLDKSFLGTSVSFYNFRANWADSEEMRSQLMRVLRTADILLGTFVPQNCALCVCHYVYYCMLYSVYAHTHTRGCLAYGKCSINRMFLPPRGNPGDQGNGIRIIHPSGHSALPTYGYGPLIASTSPLKVMFLWLPSPA